MMLFVYFYLNTSVRGLTNKKKYWCGLPDTFFYFEQSRFFIRLKVIFFQPIRERVKQKLHVNLYELLKYIVFCIGKTKQLYHGWSQQDSRVPQASLFPEAKRIVEKKIHDL